MNEDQIRQRGNQSPDAGGEHNSGSSFNPTFNPKKQEASMNQDQTKGKFDQLKGKLKETWGRLTDDELALYNGKRDQFFGKLQEKYGLAKEEAQDRLDEIEKSCGCESSSKAA
jgi:uncharacterized protein YjbJ (UPF0337 family)